MSPARYPLRHSATIHQNQPNQKRRKKLPRPGIEPESLRPQRNILAVRPPKHLFFSPFSLVELLGLVTLGTPGTHNFPRLEATLAGHEAAKSLARHSVHRDTSTSTSDYCLATYSETSRPSSFIPSQGTHQLHSTQT